MANTNDPPREGAPGAQSSTQQMDGFSRERESEIARAQHRPAPGLPDLTMRDLANALVVGSFRNGFVEELHAGRWSPLLTNPSLSRITDAEMKKLNVEMSARLAWLLDLFFEHPERFADQFAHLRLFTRSWDRRATSFELPSESVSVPVCAHCAEPLWLTNWRFCPSCGKPTA